MTYIRDGAAAYRTFPIRWILLGVAIVLGVVAASAQSTGYNALTSALAVAALIAAVDLACRFPSAAATTVVVVCSSVLATPVSVIYAFGGSGGNNIDPQAAVATVMALFALTGLLAHRTSRTKPWLTTLLVAVGIMFVGPFLVILAPLAGFAWAWLVMAVVLTWRGGGGAWLIDQAHGLRETLTQFHTRRRTDTIRNTLTGNDWADSAGRTEKTDRANKQAAQLATADLLADLPEGHVVFHDRTLRNGYAINHLVVGPTGVFVIESEQFKGRVHEDPTHGLTHRQINVAALLNDTDTLAAYTARQIKLKDVRTYPTVVIHQAILPVDRAQVALSTDGSTLGTVTVTTPNALLGSITSRPDVFNERQVARIVARVNRMCPPATSKTLPTKGLAKVPVDVTVLDEDGNPKNVTHAAPLFSTSESDTVLTVGQQVILLTDQGTYSGYRVTGEPTIGDDNVTLIPVAPTHTDPTDEFFDLETVDATQTWFPLDSVQPAETTDH